MATAHDQIRAMLDELMGSSRNGEAEDAQVKFDDPKVCKSFLLSSCPHDILAATRMDLGECNRIHNLSLRADYEKARLEKDYFYDVDALEQLEIFIADADRKTEQAKRRLAETQEELSTDVAVKADKVNELAEKIGENLAKAETLGEEGFVEESMKIMEEIEQLRKLKSESELDYRNSIPAATFQQQKLRVCEVCCAFLGIHDNDRRLADHFGGKLHLGFIKIRDTLKEYQINSEERRRKRREEMRKYRNREAEMWEEREKEREREREREREERIRERERKERSKRSRSSERGHRDRDRDKSRRKRRSRSRSRSRSKSKSHSHRNRSRSRERKSRHK